jgi:tRNA threonylcarbamoyladenosine biosynthesis protein TsaB
VIGPLILSVNTATVPFSVALVKENRAVIAETLLACGSKSFALFMSTLHEMLLSTKLSLKELKAVAVVKGPGSFTGLRVGLSAVKGICRGLGIPAVGVSGLETLAAQCAVTPFPICPLIDSRKGEFFTSLYRALPGERAHRVKEETCLNITALDHFVVEPTLFVGNDYERQGALIREALGARALLAPAFLWNLRASAVGMLGVTKAKEGRYDDLSTLVPAYMRPPDIRPNQTVI